MSDSAARHRARQTIINLCLALAACIALVVTIVLIVPRDDSNRIKAVDYATISRTAKATYKFNIITINPPANWWCNSAAFNLAPIDAVQTFKAGFVGSDVKYIGYTQAFETNPTWLALKLNGKVLTGEYSSGKYTWQIYKSVVQNNPAKTMDYMMVLNNQKNEHVFLYGVAETKEFETFANEIEDRLRGVTQID